MRGTCFCNLGGCAHGVLLKLVQGGGNAPPVRHCGPQIVLSVPNGREIVSQFRLSSGSFATIGENDVVVWGYVYICPNSYPAVFKDAFVFVLVPPPPGGPGGGSGPSFSFRSRGLGPDPVFNLIFVFDF